MPGTLVPAAANARRARAGRVKDFTGLDDPYEPPLNPDVECRTDPESVGQSAQKVLDSLTQKAGASRLRLFVHGRCEHKRKL